MSDDGNGNGGTGSSSPGSSGGGTSDSGSGIAAQAKAAIDQFRSVGKWIITSFAAVATLLLTGVQLTSIGSVSGVRLGFAIGGLAVSVLAIIVAISSLTTLLQPHVSAPETAIAQANTEGTPLNDFFEENKTALVPSGIDNAEELKTEFDRLRAKTDRSASEQARFRSLRASYTDIVWWASYLGAKTNFDRSRILVIIAAVVVAAGASVYSWAATGPTASNGTASATPTTAIASTPVAVIVRLNSTGANALKGILTSACINAAATNGIDAIAISADSTGATVVITRSLSCQTPIEITIPLSDGVAMIPTPVSPPISKPTPSTSASSS